MKNSKEHSKKIQKLYRAMKQQSARSTNVEYDEPVDALVHAVVNENMTEPQTQAAIKKLKEHFVDWNDLRVAAVDEIVEVLGQDITTTRDMATRMVEVLRAVFEKYNMLSLQGLRKLGKRPAKMLLEKLNGITPFVVDYCMLTAMQGHAIPLTPRMIEHLKANGFIHAEASYEEIEGFLAKQIATKNAYEFYAFLRRESESPKTQKASKTQKTKKSKKK